MREREGGGNKQKQKQKQNGRLDPFRLAVKGGEKDTGENKIFATMAHPLLSISIHLQKMLKLKQTALFKQLGYRIYHLQCAHRLPHQYSNCETKL